jgi:3-deoxy-manno-octulosonate cytidylyltransferase (CMP-KDO synthetase)
MARCVALIPARFGSTRLPGKPLLKETGKFLIQHVYERVAGASCASRVIVATDDDRIAVAVQRFGGEAVLTSRDHPSGTDRVAEAAAALDAEILLNIQGDEPDIEPDLLDEMAAYLAEGGRAELVTAAVPIACEASFASPHVVKVVTDADRHALYFSRAPIPNGADPLGDAKPLKHIGVYAYRRRALLALTREAPAPLERLERLEQLRALHLGMAIKVIVTDKDHLGIDTREEYDAFVKAFMGTRERQA